MTETVATDQRYSRLKHFAVIMSLRTFGSTVSETYVRQHRVETATKLGKEFGRDYSAVMGNPALTVWCKRPLQAQRTKARGKGRRTVKRSGRRRI